MAIYDSLLTIKFPSLVDSCLNGCSKWFCPSVYTPNCRLVEQVKMNGSRQKKMSYHYTKIDPKTVMSIDYVVFVFKNHFVSAVLKFNCVHE